MTITTINYAHLKQLSKELKRPACTLIVLAAANDPFYLTPARQDAGRWFARLWQQRLGAQRGHDRDFHYKLVSQRRPVRYLDGTPYKNIEPHWEG
jgi:hypothetical protein